LGLNWTYDSESGLEEKTAGLHAAQLKK
jgi:hypothetical protein